jgi:hypothetical protein
MANTSQISDRDLIRFAHEPERRFDRIDAPPPRESEAPMRMLRSLPNPRDKSLSSLAQAWRDQLPAGLRPDALCESYPRVANRVALCWPDPALVMTLIDDLLDNRRGARKGFPQAVQRELGRLRDLATQQPR